MNTSLNAHRRESDLSAVQEEVVDVLVVGGGVTGTGVALDAASRGLSVCLLEAHDLAFGTSRWSSKLVHGGLRYLAHGDVALAHESAVERGILMTRTAPHLVHALPMLFPLHGKDNGFKIMAGLRAGDLLRRAARTPSSVLPPPRRVSPVEALALVPGLRATGLRSGLLSFDGQLIDDARLVLALARTAAGFGARIITRARVTTLTGDGATAVDGLTGTSFSVRARAVINASGVWAGTLVPSVRLRPSLGSHLVLDANRIGFVGTAVTFPVGRNRFALMLPQPNGRVYLGLTDSPVDWPVPDVVPVPESDVDFLLDAASTVLQRPLTRADVLGSYAGLRPLLDAPGSTADLSRRHAVLRAPNGVVTIVGGKLTTYRRMAADAVDAVGLAAGPCRTASLRLVSSDAARVAALSEVDPELGVEVAPGVTAADVVWAVRHEGALDADDVLDRRTRIGLVAAERAAAEPLVADLVSRSLAGL
ncbi:glycerol-3-phosphate dehydrogenase [Lentzea sp. NBRC 105346]|uniref:glycerol-3-phosphate dehydrogenase/oxidase n=1 Tax=Lentzea sp. NBRC 105346 TaxID=3032205 RepID=UPI0024A5B3AD|nr:glycerol-3-phosphate dehydrogenase/oxidase [Lentzea sp. NBRC 105346]GLZ34389.1 glycerol-3-phosphate dehydrogenase [Lentzea sp. NBRC 105346]